MSRRFTLALPTMAGNTVDAYFIRESDSKWWRASDNTWQALDADIDWANYQVAATEDDSLATTPVGAFLVDVPNNAAFGAGRFVMLLYQNSLGDPSDPIVFPPEAAGRFEFTYNGAEIVEDLVYHARVDLVIDDANSQDEWTVHWFRNGVLVDKDSGNVNLEVIKRADGTDLIASTAMTAIGTTKAYKLDATTTSRVTAGEAVLAKVTATIDGATRTWQEIRARDG